MSRGLIGFLAFLAVVLLGLAVAGYLLGTNVLAFVFHPERRTEPVVIINLLQFADPEHEQRYRLAYAQPATEMIETLQGHPVWAARADRVVRGRAHDGWSTLELVAYPSRSAFIELVTSSNYRALMSARSDAVERSAVLAGTAVADFDAAGTQAQAVRFLTGAREDSIDSYDATWLSQDASLLQRHAGKLIWRARLNPLAADEAQRFGEMLVYGFSDADHRSAWAADIERETLQTLERRLFRRDVLVLADADAEQNSPSGP